VHEAAPRGARTLVSSDPVVSPSPAKSAAQRANVLIIVLDAARADHCGCYGYRRETTPNIDRLAEESVLFGQHFTTFPYTAQSTASLMTGLYPDTHLTAMRSPLPDSAFTLARGLGNAGLETAFFSSNMVASSEKLDKDFALRVTASVLARRRSRAGRNAGASWRDPASLLDAFGTWLRSHDRGRFFAYLHFLPPHVPYNAPEAMKALFARRAPPRAGQRDSSLVQAGRRPSPHAVPATSRWVNLYDANLRWGDWAVGQVYKALRESGQLENTLLIITSDHGEAFGEHGWEYHGGSVYDEMVHVPLLLRLPNQQHRGHRVSALTQNVDILPTVFDYLRIGYPRDAVQGRSLMPLISRSESSVHDYVFATCLGYPSYLVRDTHYALILHRAEGTRELYDLRADPGQRRNTIAAKPEVEERMLAAFRQFALSQKQPPLQFLDARAHMRAEPPPNTGALTPETRRELQALGYLE
jgi:arylsulfatase